MTALTAGALLLPVQFTIATPTASADSGKAARTASAEADTIKVKIGIDQGALNEIRAQGRKAAGAGKAHTVTTRPAHPQSAQRSTATTAKTTLGKGDLKVLDAEQTAREVAAAYPQPGRSAKSLEQPAVAAPIGEKPDADLVRDCLSGSNVESGIGRVHNRFTYCRRIGLEAEYWSIDSKGVPVELEGTTTAKLEVFTQGDDKERRVRVFSRFQEDSVDYDWGPIDNIFTAPNVPESLIAQCTQGSDVCHATRGAATLPWVVWDNSTDWYYWDVYNHEENSEGRDKISYNQWFVETFTDNGEYQTLKRGRTPARMLRCDSATYFNQGQAKYPKACVFNEVTPRLNYQLGSDHHAVAFHIYTAQYHPDDTYPLLVPPDVPAPRDKRIPGRYDPDSAEAPGLHRITAELHPGETKANGDHKDGACYKKGPQKDEYLDTGLPTPPGAGEQCDEYPFASTLEGAGNPQWDFSVKAVPQRDNSVAGGLLRSYYVKDRVLAWDAGLPRPDETNDRYYVHIE